MKTEIKFLIPEKAVENDTAIKTIYVPDITEEQWLIERAKGIGGTDAASIYVPGKYGTPTTVYAYKKGIVEPEDISNKLAVKRGNRLENCVIVWFQEEYEKETGKEIQVFKSPWIYESYTRPYMKLNIDGLVYVDECVLPDGNVIQGLGLLEVKTGGVNTKRNWKADGVELSDPLGELPGRYQVQIQYYLAGLGLEFCILPIWFDGEIYWRVILRNDELIDCILEETDQFWKNFQNDIMPEPKGYEAEKKVLLKSFPESNEETITDDSLISLFEEYEFAMSEKNQIESEYKPQIDEANKKLDSVVSRIKIKMGKNKSLQCVDWTATWNRFTKKAYTVSESVSERFTIKKI
jgi:predicted phage-related endonuclease